MSWIQTLEGSKFDLLNPSADAIDPNTLAICLARTCRFKGHSRDFYSVAQHSLLVESLMVHDSLRLPALLHDAHEMYDGFGDIARPAKYLNEDVRRFLKAHQAHVNVAVASRFGFDPQLFKSDHIAHADMVALSTEQRDVMVPCEHKWDAMPMPHPVVKVEPWSIDESYRRFISRLYELWSK